jgi:hypothetical protein
MQDGYTQSGAGPSDMRVAGEDLQHHRQPRTADEAPSHKRMQTRIGDGGPQLSEIIAQEAKQHAMGRQMRLDHLKNHYER